MWEQDSPAVAIDFRYGWTVLFISGGLYVKKKVEVRMYIMRL